MTGVTIRMAAQPGFCGAWLWDLSVFGNEVEHCELKRGHEGPHRHGTVEWTHAYVRNQPACVPEGVTR